MVEVHSLNIGGGKIMKTMTNVYLSFGIFVISNSSSLLLLQYPKGMKIGCQEGHIFECEIKQSKHFYCVKIFFAEIFNGGSALFKYWWWKDNEDNDK